MSRLRRPRAPAPRGGRDRRLQESAARRRESPGAVARVERGLAAVCGGVSALREIDGARLVADSGHQPRADVALDQPLGGEAAFDGRCLARAAFDLRRRTGLRRRGAGRGEGDSALHGREFESGGGWGADTPPSSHRHRSTKLDGELRRLCAEPKTWLNSKLRPCACVLIQADGDSGSVFWPVHEIVIECACWWGQLRPERPKSGAWEQTCGAWFASRRRNRVKSRQKVSFHGRRLNRL